MMLATWTRLLLAEAYRLLMERKGGISKAGCRKSTALPLRKTTKVLIGELHAVHRLCMGMPNTICLFRASITLADSP